MKAGVYHSLLLSCLLFGCGSDLTVIINTDQAALIIIQTYDFETEGEPQTEDLTLPSEFTDAHWGLKETVCRQAGYDLTPHAGQTVSSMRYSIREKYNYFDEPLYLWILIKGDTCVCPYVTVREDSGLTPGVFAVNDPAIQ